MRTLLILISSLFFSLWSFCQPTIQFFNPVSAPIGSTIKITGTGFSGTPVIYFGSVKGSIVASSPTEVDVAVPAGATYSTLSVTVNGLTAYSRLPFVPSFAGSGSTLTSTSFAPQANHGTGPYPHSTSIGDFNQDGKPDLLVSKGSSSTVTIFPGKAPGALINFESKIEIPASGNNHEGSAVGDMDGDGRLDFIVSNVLTNNSISVFRNNSSGGNISFAPFVDLPADIGPYLVAIGDINNDGKPDIVSANNGANTISVYKNQSTIGNISFASRMDITVGTNPYGIAIGDLDKDNKADLVVSTQGSANSIFVLGNISTSSVQFGPPINIASTSGAFNVALGDIDNDGNLDIVAAESGAGVKIIRNISTPGIMDFKNPVFISGNVYCVAISDLNGDSRPDIVTANRTAHTISAIRNNSTPGSLSFNTPVSFPAGNDPIWISAGDLDADGRPDLVASNSSFTSISVYKNLIDAGLAPAITSFTPTSGVIGSQIVIKGENFTGASAVTFGGEAASSFTVDSSNGITAVVGMGKSGNVEVTTQYGTARLPGFVYSGPVITLFTPTVGVQGTVVNITGTNFTGATSVSFGGTAAQSFTVNSSTSISAVLGSGSSGQVSVITPAGTATLNGFSFGIPIITSLVPDSASVGDTIEIQGSNFNPLLNGNIVHFGAVQAQVLNATNVKITAKVPAGATYQPVTVTTNTGTSFSPLPFNVTFLNDTSTVTAASFETSLSVGTGSYPFDVYMADINNDGKSEIITVNGNANSISVIRNISTPGQIDYSIKTDFSTGPGPRRIAIGDLDNDAKLDLVVSNFNNGNASTISVFRNTSTGSTISLAPGIQLATGDGVMGVSIMDLNLDGKADITVTSGNAGYISIFKNTTAGIGNITFGNREDLTHFFHPGLTIAADIDGDRKPEIITANFGSASISVYRNASVGGNLTFHPKIDFPAPTHAGALSAGDLDGDNKLDIVVSGSGEMHLLRNISSPGNISFTTAFVDALTARGVTLSDINGDGKPDILTGRQTNGMISIYENSSLGISQISFKPRLDLIIGNFDTGVASGDISGDGKPEILVANTLQNNVVILENKIKVPEIENLSANTGGFGDTIRIAGDNFIGVTGVSFGGVPASNYTVDSSKAIRAVVAGGASGDIIVISPGGFGKIGGFQFIPRISSNGALSFCSGQSVQLTSTAESNNQWYRNNSVISGATGKSFTATTSGLYTVKTTGNGITTTSVNAVSVTVNPVPPTPTISKNASNQLVSSAPQGNQWFLNNSAIAGATGQIYQPTQNGSYTVQASLDGCTSTASSAYNYNILSVYPMAPLDVLTVFPNPVQDYLYLKQRQQFARPMDLHFINGNGTLVFSMTNFRGERIYLGHLPAGIYILQIAIGQADIYIYKLTKIHR